MSMWMYLILCFGSPVETCDMSVPYGIFSFRNVQKEKLEMEMAKIA